LPLPPEARTLHKEVLYRLLLIRTSLGQHCMQAILRLYPKIEICIDFQTVI
jgi:hypothetical protein